MEETITLARCKFNFISLRTGLYVHVIGIEKSWEQLKQNLDLNFDPLPNASVRYYETIGCGPCLFAVCDETVYYNHHQQWYPYHSATGIEHDTITIKF